MGLYIELTTDDLANICERCDHDCFSRSALDRILEWSDENDITEEWDCAEIRGMWAEYDDAWKMWQDNRQVDYSLPHFYDPEQLEALVTAMESRGIVVMQLDNGNWLIREP